MSSRDPFKKGVGWFSDLQRLGMKVGHGGLNHLDCVCFFW